MLDLLLQDIKKQANPEKAKILQGFFKTGVGEYGEGDRFLGITVPALRILVKKYKDLTLPEISKLLYSPFNEERFTALMILVEQYKKADEKRRKEIYEFYLKNRKRVNNWGLVDSSADKIMGEYLLDKNKDILYVFAKSDKLWERRIAIIATYAFIKKGKYEDTLKISELLLHDKHDLIQKAVGWMLREVGKRCSREVLVEFLGKHYKEMPRTMLRYSIEHFPESTRRAYIEGKV